MAKNTVKSYQRPEGLPELLFQEVVGVNVKPTPENCDSVIFSARFFLADGVFTFETDTITIQAKKVSWRDVSQWMGPHARYGPVDSLMSQAAPDPRTLNPEP